TIGGRYYGMDRDKRWERVALAYDALVDASGEKSAGARAAIEAGYARGENDEFVKPTVIAGHVPMADGDAVVFMNFRADRAREITAAFVHGDEFAGFARPHRPKLAAYVTLTEYAADLPVTAVGYPPQSMRNTLPEYVASLGLRQLRIAETEKYAHVTFFLNGGREAPFPGEDRILVPSPKVATYDLQPEMSCPEVTAKLCAAIRSREYDLVVCNIANPDMVGHTGVFEAAVKAAETVDWALGEITAALRDAGGEMLLSADHGNLEMMRDPATGQAHTAHTTGPVPLVYFGRRATLAAGGALCDLAPTALALMGLPQPPEMTGRSLVTLA
ncbi:MAG TPA: 2,3-bisphosphoglycerate-independent phosphoglycerate mutase, partial [Xanthomonadales bacterium]|nr:2,3-bisphosphoglycerate-independent phosphoglycerate mutase [Xanthomonadales bacterium]